MRVVLSVGIALLAAAFVATPVRALDGTFMWCQATVDNGAEASTYHSAFFAAGAHQAEAKARAFKSEVEDEETSAGRGAELGGLSLTPGWA